MTSLQKVTYKKKGKKTQCQKNETPVNNTPNKTVFNIQVRAQCYSPSVSCVFTWSRLAVSAADVPAQSCVNVIGRQGALEGAGLLGLHGAGGGAGDVAGARARPAVGGERRPGGRAVQTHHRLTGARRRTCAQATRCAL